LINQGPLDNMCRETESASHSRCWFSSES